MQYLALARATAASGLWPVVVLLAMSVALVRGQFGEQLGSFVRRMPEASAALAITAGVTAAAALAAYAVATRHQLAAVAVVLSSLYPVIPFILGVTVLRERLTAKQTAGLLAAGSATVLLAV
ncbi:hypothetical protein CQY20_10210 [Mycolicibacterium agri]|uniref:Uncharacterized protein n=1 Tax=Mycolicibacterium agri TaxID=36811 RepID=A0A2A7N681_MYCAG|nr:hypothetical protein CQY20_10210 [Mycolicibacterium agri]